MKLYWLLNVVPDVYILSVNDTEAQALLDQSQLEYVTTSLLIAFEGSTSDLLVLDDKYKSEQTHVNTDVKEEPKETASEEAVQEEPKEEVDQLVTDED